MLLNIFEAHALVRGLFAFLGCDMGCSSCGGSFFGSAANVVMAGLTGRQVLASDDVLAARLAQCAVCEHIVRYQPGSLAGDDVTLADKCSQCGCYVKVKASFETESCPLGKWSVQDGEAEGS